MCVTWGQCWRDKDIGSGSSRRIGAAHGSTHIVDVGQRWQRVCRDGYLGVVELVARQHLLCGSEVALQDIAQVDHGCDCVVSSSGDK